MKLTKVLMLAVLLVAFIATLNGQQSSSLKLGKEYEGKAYPLSDGVTILTSYIFEKPSRVILRRTTLVPGRTQTQMLFNMATGRMEPTMVTLPPSSISSDTVGTYSQQGNKVRIDFSDSIIEAKIVRDGLEGIITYKGKGNKEGWAAIKRSDDIASTPSPKESESKQAISETDLEAALKFEAEGNELYKQKKYVQAIAKFNEAINLVPQPTRFYLARGKAQFMLNNYREAIKDFDNFLPSCQKYECTRPNLEDFYRLRGNAKLKLKDFSDAISDYDEFFQLDKRTYKSASNVSDLRTYEQLAATYAEVYKNRGTAKYKLGNISSACNDFQKACEFGEEEACKTADLICK